MSYGIFAAEYFFDCEGFDEIEHGVTAGILQYPSGVRFYTDETMTEELTDVDMTIMFDTEKEAADYIYSEYPGVRYNKKGDCYLTSKEPGALWIDDAYANGYYRTYLKIISLDC